jgi:hypothetical protein
MQYPKTPRAIVALSTSAGSSSAAIWPGSLLFARAAADSDVIQSSCICGVEKQDGMVIVIGIGKHGYITDDYLIC